MKKTILIIALSVFSVLALITPTSASTLVSLSPTALKVGPGQNFNVTISINPQGVNDYAEKLVLNYPADLIQVNSFTLSSPWMALSQTGYDLIDNEKGIFIKSAGYPGGFASSTSFGTISFSAKKAGKGAIMIGKDSLAFEVNNQTALTGQTASVDISAPIVAPANPITVTNPTSSETNKKPVVVSEEKSNKIVAEPAKENTVKESEAINNDALVGQVGSASNSRGSGWFVPVSIIIILILGVYFLTRKKK